MSVQGPTIDYLAKDYESFRQLMLDRLSATLPAWSERHPPDLGIAIVEALAYVGDYLSYYQDAVGTEAYLGTARQRISVRRHARLLDYVLHEGCNARAWVQVQVDQDLDLDPCNLEFLAVGESTDPLAALDADELRTLTNQSYLKFLPVDHEPINLRPSWNCLDLSGKLMEGATRATLKPGCHNPHLKNGQILILQAQLNSVDYVFHAVAFDHIEGNAAGGCDIVWHEDDALPAYMAGQPDIVALGNIVLVDQGHWDSPTETTLRVADGRLGPLSYAGLTWRQPQPALESRSATRSIAQNPRAALPQIVVQQRKGDCCIAWTVKADLLDSLRTDHHICAEVDDKGNTWLRFGDGGGVGARPEDDQLDGTPQFGVKCRIGNGERGNVPANTIRRIVIKASPAKGPSSSKPISSDPIAVANGAIKRVWNPMPAAGGSEPESAARARLLAPAEMRIRQHRAISPEDYANFARSVSGVQNAAVTIVQQGARRVVRVAVDPLGFLVPALGEPDHEIEQARWRALARRVSERLNPVRRINHDVSVIAPRYVDVAVKIRVKIFSSHIRQFVLDAVRRALALYDSPKDIIDPLGGGKGLFHPDNLTFGEHLYWSRIVSRAHSIPGVEYVEQAEFRRVDSSTEEPASEIKMGPLEIARLKTQSLSDIDDPSVQ